jgi:hypothetical protein
MSSYVPPQHGAWAFLGLPVVLGLTVSTWTPVILALAVAWVAAYPWSYAAFGLVRAARPQRFRAPFALWSALLAVSGVVVLAARPWIVWVALLYLVLFAVNLRYASRNDERALANDLVFVVECAAMVVVVWAVGAGGGGWVPPALSSVPAHAWVLAIVCGLVLLGSTLHVKSLIRERRDPRYARASRIYAVLCVAAALALGAWWGLPGGAWLVLPFAVLAVRAFVVPRWGLRPSRVGLLELGFFLLVALCALLAA